MSLGEVGCTLPCVPCSFKCFKCSWGLLMSSTNHNNLRAALMWARRWMLPRNGTWGMKIPLFYQIFSAALCLMAEAEDHIQLAEDISQKLTTESLLPFALITEEKMHGPVARKVETHEQKIIPRWQGNRQTECKRNIQKSRKTNTHFIHLHSLWRNIRKLLWWKFSNNTLKGSVPKQHASKRYYGANRKISSWNLVFNHEFKRQWKIKWHNY